MSLSNEYLPPDSNQSGAHTGGVRNFADGDLVSNSRSNSGNVSRRSSSARAEDGGQAIQDEDQLNRRKKREVYRYQTNWLVSSVAWARGSGDAFNLALSSYRENYKNFVQLVSLARDEYEEEIQCISTFEHPYPATKVLWQPTRATQQTNLLATTADYLRIWRVNSETSNFAQDDESQPQAIDGLGKRQSNQLEVKLECLLNCNQGAKYCAPLTSFDWNEVDPSVIVTSSVDTSCAVWDLETSKVTDTITSRVSGTSSVVGTLRNQLMAHDHQVYDVSFSPLGGGRDVFVTAGGDGSVRLFDLRRLSTSTILFEDTNLQATPSGHKKKAFVRVACSKQDSNLVATFTMDSKDIILLDVRKPDGQPVATLGNHSANLNSLSWAPHSAHHICSAAEDQQALIWELSKLPDVVEEPLLAYKANGKINVISWSASHPDWIAIGFENYMDLLRV